MTKVSFVLACLLFQCVKVLGSQAAKDDLKRSTDTLRTSEQALSRSQSQELDKLVIQVAVSNFYYEFPANSGFVCDKRERMPLPPHYYHSDCP